MKLQVRFDKDGWSSSGSLILIISRKTCFPGAAPAIYEYMFNTEGSSITTTMYVAPNSPVLTRFPIATKKFSSRSNILFPKRNCLSSYAFPTSSKAGLKMEQRC